VRSRTNPAANCNIRLVNLVGRSHEQNRSAVRTDYDRGNADVRERHTVTTPSDEQLMAAIGGGDSAALSLLVTRYQGPLFGYLYRFTSGDRQLAEDLVQETFIRVLRQRTFRAGRPVKPWLYAIATNAARDSLRRAAREITLNLEDATERLADPEPGPEAVMLALAQDQAIAQGIAQLPDEYRATLLLRYYHDFSLQEIADALAVPLGTVKSRLSVGTHRLRDALQRTEAERR